jgi:DNA-binding CsgD family transcriptional regulator
MRDANALSLVASVVMAVDQADLYHRMKAAAAAFGFEHVLFGIQIVRPFAEPLQHIASAYPEGYQQLYGQRAYVMLDPTVAHCQGNLKPLEWSESMYSERSYEIMEESRQFGLSHGLSVPVHENADVKSMLSLARDKPFESETERQFILDGGHVLANCIHVATSRLIVPGLIKETRPHLTGRERECLQLVATGKSNSVISDLLNISEPTVAFHMKNVLEKLGVATRMQAVAKGVAMKLIT